MRGSGLFYAASFAVALVLGAAGSAAAASLGWQNAQGVEFVPFSRVRPLTLSFAPDAGVAIQLAPLSSNVVQDAARDREITARAGLIALAPSNQQTNSVIQFADDWSFIGFLKDRVVASSSGATATPLPETTMTIRETATAAVRSIPAPSDIVGMNPASTPVPPVNGVAPATSTTVAADPPSAFDPPATATVVLPLTTPSGSAVGVSPTTEVVTSTPTRDDETPTGTPPSPSTPTTVPTSEATMTTAPSTATPAPTPTSVPPTATPAPTSTPAWTATPVPTPTTFATTTPVSHGKSDQTATPAPSTQPTATPTEAHPTVVPSTPTQAPPSKSAATPTPVPPTEAPATATRVPTPQAASTPTQAHPTREAATPTPMSSHGQGQDHGHNSTGSVHGQDSIGQSHGSNVVGPSRGYDRNSRNQSTPVVDGRNTSPRGHSN